VHERPGRRQPVAARAHLAEATADRERRIAGLRQLARERGRGCAEPGPQRQRIALGEDALALEGGRDGRRETLGQLGQLRPGAGRAQAQVEQRPACARQDGDRPLERLRVDGRGRHALGGERRLQLGRRRVGAEEVVLRRDLHEHGPRPPAARQGARPTDGAIHLRTGRRPQLRLRHGRDQRRLVDVVELVGPTRVPADPAPEHQQRHAVEVRLGDTRERVRQSGARHDVDAAQASGCAPDRVGHERGRLLVRDQHGPYAARVRQRVVQLDVVRAGNAEREGDFLVLEGTHDDLAARHGHASAP